MKRKVKLLIVFNILIFLGFSIHLCFFSMHNLPKGEFLYKDTSPQGTYTLKVYFCYGGSLSSDAVRVELIDNNKKGKKKNIYWEYRASNAMITWIDDNKVKINDHELSLPNDKYDWRKDEEWRRKHVY